MRLQNFSFRLSNSMSLMLAMIVISGALSGCGGAKPAVISTPEKPSGIYKVVEIDQTSILESHPTMNFDLGQNRISGSAGCNNYSGTLVMSENNDNSFIVDSIMSTKMYCSDEVMSVEYKFLKYLGQPLQWAQKADTLSLTTDESQSILIAVKTQDQ